jgi:hypothetical protein
VGIRRAWVVSLGALLAGCVWRPSPQCEGEAPLCYESQYCAESAVTICSGEPTPASCIDEDGDVHWYCFDGTEAEYCAPAGTVCAPWDGGMP